MGAQALTWLVVAHIAFSVVVSCLFFIWRTLAIYRRDSQCREYEAASTFGGYQLPPDLVDQLAKSTAVPPHGLG